MFTDYGAPSRRFLPIQDTSISYVLLTYIANDRHNNAESKLHATHPKMPAARGRCMHDETSSADRTSRRSRNHLACGKIIRRTIVIVLSAALCILASPYRF